MVVSEVTEHALDLRSFILVPPKPAPRFRPGQFLHLALDLYDPSHHWPESRAFSIANSPDNREGLRITVSKKRSFTVRMFEDLRPGAAAWIKLPYGSFTPTPSADAVAVFLGGGTGITPFISFIEWAAAEKSGGKIQIHYAARRPELLIYKEILEACRAQLSSLALFFYAEQLNGNPLRESSGVTGEKLPFSMLTTGGAVLSSSFAGEGRGEGIEESPSVPRLGRIEIPEIWRKLDSPEKTRFYLSGPKPMIDASREALLELGAAPGSVIMDEWG